ncbi:MAG: alpha/beta hydrolase family protein [Bryobacteraceae bacterium]
MDRLGILWLLFLLAPAYLSGAGVKVLFDPTSAAVGPFPTDFLTVPDPLQKSGLRVNLPLPNCAARPTDCDEVRLINNLDGFSLQPRARVRFSAPVNPDTLRDGIYFVWLDALSRDEPGLGPVGKLTPINEVMYDPGTNTAYARPDDFFDQTRRYALVVTTGVRDTRGDPVEADEGFPLCLSGQVGGAYCQGVGRAMETIRRSVPPGQQMTGGSLFTTMTATAVMEQARATLESTSAQSVRPGNRNVFDASSLATVTFRRHVGPFGLVDENSLPGPSLAQAGLGRMAFFVFRSPRFVSVAGSLIPIGSGSDIDLPRVFDELTAYVLLPARPMPPGGYPVVVAGHGINDSQFGMPTAMILGLVSRGFAVVAINAFGHGGGPNSSVRLRETNGTVTDVLAPGRAVDLDQNGRYEDFEGCIVLSAGAPLGMRDCLRQTALDLSQLVRVLRSGVDLDGDGQRDLSAERLSYVGQSLGSFYGTLFAAIEPNLTSAVLNAGGGSATETLRFSPGFRGLFRLYVFARNPLLFASPQDFDEVAVLRYQPVRLITSRRVVPLIEILDILDWLESPGAPYAFATHLRSSPLRGNPTKRVMFQFAIGDRTVPNPANTMLVRAANLREMTSAYRHDLARPLYRSLPENPHTYLAGVLGDPPFPAIALAAQAQAALFLSGVEDVVPDVTNLLPPSPAPLFEVPDFLTETLNFE